MTQTPSPSVDLPHVHLLCHQESASEAFAAAVRLYKFEDKISYTVHNCSLSQLDPSLKFDLVVSPANSYGILDGGFDDAISRAWSPKDDYTALTRHVQAELYEHYRGYLPPGSCHLVPMPEAWKGRLRYNDGQGWACRYIALCPTMRMPSDVTWDREVVFECIWSLLNAMVIENRKGAEIKSMLMTPLATGTGRVSEKKWAEQCILAVRHFLDAGNNREKWSSLDWPDAGRMSLEVQKTHGL